MASHTQCHCGDQFVDHQKEFIRKAVCKDLPAIYLHGGQMYCVLHYPVMDKEAAFEKVFRARITTHEYCFYGTWFPGSINLSNHSFGDWADFAWTTFDGNVTFESSRFRGNAQFLCSTFTKKVSFSGAVFSADKRHGLPTNFYSAAFEDEADFSSVRFESKVEFSRARFCWRLDPSKRFAPTSSFAFAHFAEEAIFENVSFGDKTSLEYPASITFQKSTFEKLANFRESEFFLHGHFGQVTFKKTVDFRDTYVPASIGFYEASFESFARFSGRNKKRDSWAKKGLNFNSVYIEAPEKISFQSLALDPESFINTDVRRFDFTDIDWRIKNFAFDWSRSKHVLFWKERAKEARSNYELVEVAYRRVAANAEDSNQYRYASKLRYAAFEIQRLNRWYGRLPFTLLWWYKWTSRYGESWSFSTVMLALILAASAYGYTKLPFYVCPSDKPVNQTSTAGLCTIRTLETYEATRQSVATATFQTVDYRKPVTGNGEMLVLGEKILAPIQAALLALAIRRKVMR